MSSCKEEVIKTTKEAINNIIYLLIHRIISYNDVYSLIRRKFFNEEDIIEKCVIVGG